MMNGTTIGAGLGGSPSRLLAWGLGSSGAIDIAFKALRRVFIKDTARRIFRL